MGFEEVLNTIKAVFQQFIDFFKELFGMISGKTEEPTDAPA